MSESGGPILYHNVPPWAKIAYNVSSAGVLLLGLVSLLMALVQGCIVSASFVLLAMNLVLSGGLAANLWWWYRTGELSEDYVRLMFVVMAIFAFQCVVTDVWIFNYALSGGELTPGTVVPPTIITAIPGNATTVTAATMGP